MRMLRAAWATAVLLHWAYFADDRYDVSRDGSW